MKWWAGVSARALICKIRQVWSFSATTPLHQNTSYHLSQAYIESPDIRDYCTAVFGVVLKLATVELVVVMSPGCQIRKSETSESSCSCRLAQQSPARPLHNFAKIVCSRYTFERSTSRHAVPCIPPTITLWKALPFVDSGN